MKNNSIFLALLGVSALLFVGCMKEEAINEQYRPAGSEILIGASTDYDNGEATRTEYDSVEPATRTDYSGAIYGSSPKRERVDWIAGDNMTIFYKQGTAAASSGVYGVTTINPDNEKSYADVTNTSGTKLTWGDGTGDHYFYAMYPAKGFGGNNGMDLTNTNHVKGTIPATQDIDVNHKITVDGQLKYQPDMKYAYLVSYKEIAESSTATRAELPFRPAVTTFEYKFKLNANDAATERTITKFTMTATTDLTGVFEFDITGGDERGATWGTVSKSGTGKTITVNFPEGTKMTKTAYLDFSVLALPIQQENVTITFYFKDDGVEYHKSLLIKKDGNPATFAGAKKHIITNDKLAGDNVVYVFNVTGNQTVDFTGGDVTFNVESYKWIPGSPSTKVAVPWTATQYAVNDGAFSNTKPNWLVGPVIGSGPEHSAFPASGNGSTTSTAIAAYIAPSDRTVADALSSKSPLATTRANAWDLSTHAPGATSASAGTTSQKSANCYVISAPGWYKFPVVYGNMLGGAAAATQSNFVNHKNVQIRAGYLKDQSITLKDAHLVWQDSESLVTDIELSSDKTYISFYVDKTTINQGNAVIAVYDSSNQIAWSWHIWVTGHSMTAKKIRNKMFMEANLGWCDVSSVDFPARNVTVKFVQDVSGNTVDNVKFNQLSHHFETTGNGPHYAWGRKDPMLPPLGDPAQSGTKANKIWYNEAGVASQNVYLSSATKMSIADVIKNPFIVILGEYNWQPNNYYNLWNYNIPNNTTVPVYKSNPNGHSPRFPMYEQFGHGKTVYDPCPAGYTVAAPGDFIYFETQNSSMIFYAAWGADSQSPYGTSVSNNYTRTWSRGVLVKAQSGVTTADNFWPADGMREYSAAAPDKPYVNSVGKIGYYYTSSPFYQPEKSPAWEYAMIMMCQDDYGNGGVAGAGKPGFMASRGYSRTSCRSIRCVQE